jgi:hypothetical protein
MEYVPVQLTCLLPFHAGSGVAARCVLSVRDGPDSLVVVVKRNWIGVINAKISVKWHPLPCIPLWLLREPQLAGDAISMLRLPHTP